MPRSEGRLIRREVQMLSVRLSPDEVRARGERLAEAEGKARELLTRKKTIAAKLKEEQLEIDGELLTLGAIVRNRAEPREVEVEVRQAGKLSVIEVRTDTGEVVLERTMLENERQSEMFAAKGDA
jgi:hypothetical protein